MKYSALGETETYLRPIREQFMVSRPILSAYWELTKPRIVTMILVTEALGYFLGGRGVHSFTLFFWSLFGTALSCAGAAALNNFLERDIDCKMRRTRNRPIPAGTIPAAHALVFGIILILIGVSLLVAKVNLLTGFLSLLTAFLYVLVYTPLKRVTWLNTAIGAIPGALPPMGGWAAATGELGLGAWVLFAILFIWQHPHFYSIAWMYREDYASAGLKMLPVVDPDGVSTFRQILIYSVLLVPISIVPSFIGMSGPVYLIGSLVLSLMMLSYGFALWRNHSLLAARKVLRASIIYLPLLLVLFVADARW